MSKQELIDKAVKACKGKLPPEYHPNDNIYSVQEEFYVCNADVMRKCTNKNPTLLYSKRVCTVQEFTQRARELGLINGYKWGVEYMTNGVKPDLPSDCVIDVYYDGVKTANIVFGTVENYLWVKTFRIVDERYKPKVVEQKETKVGDTLDWWDYAAGKPAHDGALPPIGEVVQYTPAIEAAGAIKFGQWYEGKVVAYHNGFVWTSDNGIRQLCNTVFRPLDHATRAKELEKKRVVDAAVTQLGYYGLGNTQFLTDCMVELYNNGFLKLPENNDV